MLGALRKLANLGVLVAVVFFAQSIAHALVTWQPAKVVNGSPVLFQVSATTSTRAISGTWLGHDVTLFRVENGKLWYALAGVPLETAPGAYDLELTENQTGGKIIRVVQRIKIGRAVYPKITVTVAKQYTQPNPEQLKEAQTDKGLKQKTFAAVTARRLWSGPFIKPVSGGISDVFGTARVFNQQVQSRHQGLDYAVGAGTPVHAVNRGTVILARPLYFEGSCIVVDHGQGLLSLYLHLSEFRVKEGDEVESGQLIGLSGGSGRASGPHLHLAIRWQGVYLNPATLMKLKIPQSFVPNS
jgi:murein DD-endopeptidase MepM/ murein hydrolase activator NlpD